MELVTFNWSGANIKRVTQNGRDYLVANLVLIVPGVLNGSNGPLLYTEEDIAENYQAWNGMPMVLNHPLDAQGRAVSARDPEILARYQMGTVYKSRVVSKLAAEGWFDVQDTRRVSLPTYNALLNGKPIELSTGLFTRNEPAPGGSAVWNGQLYVATAKNHKPDHLAILPDSIGACSLKHGCGVLVNQLNHDTPGGSSMDRATIINWLTANSPAWSNAKEDLDKMPDARLNALKIEAERTLKAVEIQQAAERGFKDGHRSYTYNAERKVFVGTGDAPVATPVVAPITTPVPTPTPVHNCGGDNKSLTVEEWLAKQPEAVQNSWRYVQQVEQREKGVIVNRLINHLQGDAKNAAHTRLMAKKPAELQELLELMPPAANTQQGSGQQNNSGMPFAGGFLPDFGVQTNNNQQANNGSADGSNDDDILPLPVMNWGFSSGRDQTQTA